MSCDSVRHDLLVYDSDEQYGGQVVTYLEAGLDQGDALLAVPRRATEPVLRDALGATSEQVTFHACEDWYTRPEAVLAGYDAVVRSLLRDGAPGVRLAAELPPCSSQADWDVWIRYEAIINRAFADRPVSLLCTCDARVVPEPVLDSMRNTHTHSHTPSGGREPNPDYHEPAEVLRNVAPAPEPLPELHDVTVDDDARALRGALLRELADAGVAADRAEGLILATSEVVLNARRHGGGVRGLRVGGGDGRFACEVSDAGRGLDDPLAGFVPPEAPAGKGAGLWVARQLTRRLDLLPSPEGGLTVRLWA
jgi:anti-sigma regulatory factor (Ser/Thr protein kinase)